MRWILALAAVALAPRPARACECAAPTGPVSPADGATGLPTNAALLIDTSIEPVTSVTLTAPGGAQVALIPEPHGGFLIERPAAPLQPNTTYTVTTTRATAITSTFTTGSTSDSTPPSFAGASNVSLEVMDPVATGSNGTGCVNCAVRYQADGTNTRIHFTFPNPPPDAAMLWVELTIPGDEHPLIDVAFPPSQWNGTIDFHANCQVPAPQLTVGSSYCAQVLAIDAAGNSAGSAQPCATATECAAAFDTATCEPSPTCTPILPGDTITTNHSGGGCASAPGAAPFLIVLALAFLRRRS